MQYIVKALRQTYHNERKAYSGLNDLIDMLEASFDCCWDARDIGERLYDINDLLEDINLPVPSKEMLAAAKLLDEEGL